MAYYNLHISTILHCCTPFEAMTGRTAPSSDGLLAEVFWGFLGSKANAKRSVHSPQDHFIITLIISDRRD